MKVSDISAAMSLPRPGVTRTVKEMEKKGYLKKLASPDDGRVTYISVTEAGKALSGNMTSSILAHFPGAFRYFRGRSRLYD
ncbi:MAG: MarR family transcriptional regulator [Lachnospiraceae bacterium]